MLGIGVDTTTVSRIEKSAASPAFMQRVYGPQERQLFALRAFPADGMAANFAAKEALAKALGSGLFTFALAEAEVLRRQSGAPYFVFSGALAAYMDKNRLLAHVSLTHEAGSATAFVMVEERK